MWLRVEDWKIIVLMNAVVEFKRFHLPCSPDVAREAMLCAFLAPRIRTMNKLHDKLKSDQTSPG